MPELSSHEKDKISELINVSKSINKIYDILASLEKSGKRESLEYNTYLSYLRVAKEAEDECYKEYKGKRNKCLELFFYLYEKNPDVMAFSENDRIMQCNYDELYLHRIFNRIMNLVADDLKREFDANKLIIKKISKPKTIVEFEKYKKELKKKYNIDESIRTSLKEFLKKSRLFDSKDPFDTIEEVKIKTSILNDISMNFIINLDNSIDDELNSEVKKELIDSKYNAIFVNDFLEDILMLTNFSVPKDILFSSSFYNITIHSFNSTAYDFIIDDVVYSNLVDQMYDMFDISDSDYKLNDKKVESILRLSLIRASLPLISFDGGILKLLEDVRKKKDTNANNSYELILSSIKDEKIYSKQKIKA